MRLRRVCLEHRWSFRVSLILSRQWLRRQKAFYTRKHLAELVLVNSPLLASYISHKITREIFRT